MERGAGEIRAGKVGPGKIAPLELCAFQIAAWTILCRAGEEGGRVLGCGCRAGRAGEEGKCDHCCDGPLHNSSKFQLADAIACARAITSGGAR